jgi:surface protein
LATLSNGRFKQDIRNWDTSSVTNLTGLFLSDEAFNQGLSVWCVSEIASEPSNFDEGATSRAVDNATKPKWGEVYQ